MAFEITKEYVPKVSFHSIPGLTLHNQLNRCNTHRARTHTSTHSTLSLTLSLALSHTHDSLSLSRARSLSRCSAGGGASTRSFICLILLFNTLYIAGRARHRAPTPTPRHRPYLTSLSYNTHKNINFVSCEFGGGGIRQNTCDYPP